MRLSELKQMVKEEYSRYLKEQGMPPSLPPNPGAGGPAGGPMGGAGAPKVTVEPGDIDVMGSEDAEATLRDIYDMLKSFFEEGGAPTGPKPGGPSADIGVDDMDDDMDDMDMDDDGAADAEDADDADDADDSDDKDDDDDKDDKVSEKKSKKADKKDKKELKERFQKLANII